MDVLASSLVVAAAVAASLAASFAVAAWRSARPRVVRELQEDVAALADRQLALEADRPEWVKRLETLAATAAADLEESKRRHRSAVNAANRAAAGNTNGAESQPPRALNEDEQLDAIRRRFGA